MSLGGVDTGFLGVPSPVFRLLTSAIIQRRGTSEKDKFLLPYPYFGGVKGFLDYIPAQTIHTVEYCTIQHIGQ